MSCPTARLVFSILFIDEEIPGRRSILFWVLAVVCWVNDRVFCSLWAGLGFPYLHAAWHVLVFLASYTAVVIFAFFEAKERRNGLRAEIRFGWLEE